MTEISRKTEKCIALTYYAANTVYDKKECKNHAGRMNRKSRISHDFLKKILSLLHVFEPLCHYMHHILYIWDIRAGSNTQESTRCMLATRNMPDEEMLTLINFLEGDKTAI